MNLGFEYIKYRWKAKRRHGVHSPFIYDLTDKCFRIKPSTSFAKELKSISKELRNNNSLIEITDFGAGSKKLDQHRKISSIFKTSSSRGKYGLMLHRLTKHYQPKNVLEFGSSLGLGTICMARGTRGSVTTIEGCPATYSIAKHNFDQLALTNVQIKNLTFKDYLDELSDEQFDFVFIDGHHDGKALLYYLERLKPNTNNDTIFVLDDIRWSDSMFEAWKKIIQDASYHVTVDLFRMGIVVPRKQQVKEHFIIRP
ncbi:MAG: class I SAM-dependent methyltransferase [Crocinitomicaceae bacterium]|nr:class I SAM-dependent methyltransferase [Crocinitomicaceae bacterium]